MMITLKLLALGLSATTAYIIFKTVAALIVYQQAQFSAALRFAGLE